MRSAPDSLQRSEPESSRGETSTNAIPGRWARPASARRSSTRPLSKRYFDGRSPLGARICEGSGPDAKPNIEIVGVVADFSYRGLREESEQAYFPIFEGDDAGGNFYVKVRGTPEAAFQSIRTIVHNADPALPITYFRTLDEQVNRSLNTERMLADAVRRLRHAGAAALAGRACTA